MKLFDTTDLKKLYIPEKNSSGEQNGQITIIGGSALFHGAPFLSLKTASRIVDMVFFTSPERSIGLAAENLKSKLSSFVWIPWGEVEKYIEKSDAILIGPGMMRFTHEQKDLKTKELKNINKTREGLLTRNITEKLLKKFPHKKWVIDAGSLQTMEADWIPEKAILTPNKKEFEILFGSGIQKIKVKNLSTVYRLHATHMARKYKCVIVLKGVETIVTNGKETVIVKGGNAGLTKGGTGDVLAGLSVALLAKNDPLLAACSASYILKNTADELFKKVGIYYNSDDLADNIPSVFSKLISK